MMDHTYWNSKMMHGTAHLKAHCGANIHFLTLQSCPQVSKYSIWCSLAFIRKEKDERECVLCAQYREIATFIAWRFFLQVLHLKDIIILDHVVSICLLQFMALPIFKLHWKSAFSSSKNQIWIYNVHAPFSCSCLLFLPVLFFSFFFYFVCQNLTQDEYHC